MKSDPTWCAAEIKRAFFARKTAQLGRRYTPQERWRRDDFWEAAGAQCVELEADPESYVRAAFQGNTVPGGPFPSQLGGKASAMWWKRYADQFRQAVDGLTPFEQDIHSLMVWAKAQGLRQTKDTGGELDFYLRESSELPAYVRILLGGRSPEVVAKWRSEARSDLLSDPALLAALRRLKWSEERLKQILTKA